MTSEEKFSILRKRSEITEAVRSFFIEKGFLQVDTPILAPHVIPEAHIEIFRTEQVSMSKQPKELYLLPSPELWMKKLIAQGSGSIFQICKCFRNNEQVGLQHSNEFTMLEYYADNADYLYSLELTKELFKSLFLKFNKKYGKMPINIITVQSAFLKTTGIDIEKCPDFTSLKEAAIKAGYDITDCYTTWEEVFDLLFVSKTEPEICGKGITVLMDYPIQIPCTARKKGDSPYYERWELYIDGVEIANCYSEETDIKSVKEYYRTETAAKNALAHVPVTVDPNYPDIFRNFPKCSGTALGMDRLIMILTGCGDIKDVISAAT
ncbi:MAG: elongation factor P--(R)-beta-lysine ligase [Spirochaetia bacterium]|nr:elongation factor P--(R)-beta-lysine ligase [Spirochaetia bacterium]